MLTCSKTFYLYYTYVFIHEHDNIYHFQQVYYFQNITYATIQHTHMNKKKYIYYYLLYHMFVNNLRIFTICFFNITLTITLAERLIPLPNIQEIDVKPTQITINS